MVINLKCVIQLDAENENQVEQKVTDMNFVMSSLQYQPQIVSFEIESVEQKTDENESD